MLAETLDATVELVKRYVVFARHAQADAVALWIGHTWTYDAYDCTPYLAVQSPTRQSGKTRLMEVLRLLVREPLPAAGASLAALFRIVQEKHPTLLLDEADTIFRGRGGDPAAEDLRGLLNAGYRRGTSYLRVVGEGRKMRVEAFDTYCPKAIASIGRLPDTVQDRAVVISLKRRAKFEPVAPFRFRRAKDEATAIVQCWESIAGDLELPDEASVPEELDDRAADSWEPLLALADAAGEEWGRRGRLAAVALSTSTEPEDDQLGIRLLADIRTVFDEAGTSRLATASLIEALRGLEESPWADHQQHGLKAESLARLLRPFDIRSKQFKIGGAKVRGFDLAEHFEDAFGRYLPMPGRRRFTRYPGTDEHVSEGEGTGVPASRTPGGETKAPPWEPSAASADGPCATCGSLPIGRFPDGSACYGCGPHPPIYPEAVQ